MTKQTRRKKTDKVRPNDETRTNTKIVFKDSEKTRKINKERLQPCQHNKPQEKNNQTLTG
jgi:hypothetical protein